MDLIIDVGTGGTLGARAPQDFAVNKEVPFLFLENARVYFGKKCPQSVMSLPPKFEMLPTSLELIHTPSFHSWPDCATNRSMYLYLLYFANVFWYLLQFLLNLIIFPAMFMQRLQSCFSGQFFPLKWTRCHPRSFAGILPRLTGN